jgi:hypothetical protein
MPLTVDERVRIRWHGGYLNVAEAYTFVLGVPSSVETQFMIEGAMDRILESALPLVRSILAELDRMMIELWGTSELLDVSKLGNISIDPDLHKKRLRLYDYAVNSLMQLLGCQRNPFDKRLSSGGGMNVAVQN